MVSNRLPVSLERTGDDTWRTHPAAGGLVSALDPVMRRRGGVWVGWPGIADETTDTLRDVLDTHHNADSAYRLEPVALTAQDIAGFYEGFSNEVIWPLFHNRFTACRFEPEYWQVYQQVNREFARRINEVARADDFIWVHDYHLVNVADELRALGLYNRSSFFQHIPFPTADIFCNLPWWREIVYALLSYDFIGLQTVTDRVNLLDVLTTLFDHVETTADDDCVDVEIGDAGLEPHQHRLRIGTLPISIDYDHIAELAGSRRTAEYIERFREGWHGRTVMLGVDRLDYTKGLPEKLEAFREALTRYPELRTRISLQQHVIPSRQQVPQYAEQKEQIERLVGEINGEFTESGWVPIHYIFHSMEPAELMAHYQVADIALVTPLKDGMNLVAKEYCAATRDNNGVLILSEFAGAAAELGDHALLVNPHDVIATAERIHEAYYMDRAERQSRMQAMREIIQAHNAFDWVEDFLRAAGANSTNLQKQ
ncbi:trehalose-6-phosphate synthase [Salinisphaera sp.]|uniref:alpha,alpha-trehalose-phosphate synthase (UDP-forming) n=1 Tax=Salinisphaera sp. TaxID=1914330 RepID=UPI002D78FA30|nr:trehalose-6-phosphate synthase [Salinisphaera sp.]HET7314100.1 trehalose-6-phosphate synthase [Salinisphaera sp.]